MPGEDFVAIDVETANPDFSSICQVGIVSFKDGRVVQEWESLINPHTWFDDFNVAIHGITSAMVKGKPSWTDLHPQIADILNGNIAVCHTSFDRIALEQVCEKYRLKPAGCSWLDSARVVRRTWSDRAYSGYGLASIASHLGIEYGAHNAKEDARAAGEVLLRAVQQSGISVSDWLEHVKWRLDGTKESQANDFTRQSDGDGPLVGEMTVFTGALSVTRAQAADLAAVAGSDVENRVTEKTTLLVVGIQNTNILAGYDKSSKHRRAEELIAKGQPIRIIHEDDFMAIVKEQA